MNTSSTSRISIIAFLLLSILSCATAKPERHFTIIHFNDIYQLEPTNGGKTGGAARVKTIIDGLSQEDPLVLFSGDLFGSSQNALVLKGEDMVETINRLGLDYAVFGNHEFDFGLDVAKERVAQSKFVWIATNLADAQTQSPLAGAVPSVLTENGGVKIGIIGLIEDWLSETQAGPNAHYEDFIASGSRVAKELRSKGAEVVIALTHMSMPNDEALAKAVPEIDIILGGHDHDPMQETIDKTLILKSGSDWINLSVIRESLVPGETPSTSIDTIPVTDATQEDPATKKLVRDYVLKAIPDAEDKVGETEVPLDVHQTAVRTRETPVGNLVADAMRVATGADMALTNGGGLRSNQTYPPGILHKKDIANILPFPNTVVVLELTGAQIRTALESGLAKTGQPSGAFPHVSGISFAYDPAQPVGSRVKSISAGNVPLDDAKNYTLATNDFVAAGGSGYAILKTALKRPSPTNGKLLVTVVSDYIKKHGIVAPQNEGRVVNLSKH